ncbi:MAG TPA: hypothetical protein PKW42_02110 [bacterium]|nr:hypothetical protein [bacterium]
MPGFRKKRESLDERIRKLEEEINVSITGAPDVYRVEKQPEEEKPSAPIPQPEPVIPAKQPYRSENAPGQHVPETEVSFSFLRRPLFYLITGAIIVILLVLFFAPVLQFTTPLRADSDLPGVQIAFRYYYNIFGQKQKEETIVHLDHTRVVILLPMQQWMNLEKSKKLMAIEHYRQQD